MEGAPGSHRTRRWAALALLALAAGLAGRAMSVRAHSRDWLQAGDVQTFLEGFVAPLARIEERVPSGVPLRYACALDEHGRALGMGDLCFDVLQALLAPRRIGREVESRYVLVYAREEELWRVPGLERARRLETLSSELVLVERSGP